MLFALGMFSTVNGARALADIATKINDDKTTNDKNSMKINQLFAVCGMAAALVLGAGNVFAQNDNGGNGGNGGGGFGGGRGNFDPAQFQQRMMDNVKERLAFTNDTEWAAVQPLVQKVMDARRAASVGMSGFGRRGGPGGDTAGRSSDQSARRPALVPPSPEAEALQKAIDSDVPTEQIKAALEKHRAAHKDKEVKLTEAQENLRKVLTVKQEAQAALMGLVN